MADFLCVAGTDTDVGKTVVAAGLARLALGRGLRVLAIKPVQTGAQKIGGRLTAPDLDFCAMAAPGSETRAVELFAPACSPHLAAEEAGRRLDAAKLAGDVLALARGSRADLVIIEGAGGLLVPLNETETLADFFALLGFPLLLVAANRLGAVNHALLSLEAARGHGLDCLGVVLNHAGAAGGEMEQRIRADNGRAIARLGRAPILAEIAYAPALRGAGAGDGGRAWEGICRALAPALAAVRRRERGKSAEEVLAADRAHMWHPYTSAIKPLRVWEACGTRGARIRLRDGRELVDGMASWWCAIHGYRHPRLMDALRAQAGRMPHVMFGGLTHQPATDLAEKLLAVAPRGLNQVFLADSGSVSVEAAMKMALQYHQAQGRARKRRFLTARGGYHGDTFGAMSVCDPQNGMHSLFTGMLPQHVFAPRPACRFDAPYDPASARELELLMAEHGPSVAAVILEPIVQGAGGMWFYHPDYLARARQLCDEHGCLLILDEIATGFGRTGKMFACEHADVAPDIMCVGKGLTGGVLTLAAALATRRVAEGISAGGGALMHGPTFMGNPLACSVAGASLEILAEGRWKEDVRRIEKTLRAGLAPCAALPGAADARVLGAIGVVEMEQAVNVEKLQKYFVDQCGVWIRPFGRLIYVMPPYAADDDDIAALTRAISGALEQGLWK